MLDSDAALPRADDGRSRENRSMSRIIWGTAATGALLVGLMAANMQRDPKAVDVNWRVVQARPRTVVAESPSRGVIVQTVTAPGTVVPIDEAEIASQLVGRVTAVPVKNGDRVKRGDVLVRL